MSDQQFNLVLVSRPAINTVEEFERVGQYAHEANPRVRPIVLSDQNLRPWEVLQKWRLRSVPTLVFSPARIDKLKLPRGKVYQGFPLSKTEELGALVAKGLPVPEYVTITEEHRPDLAHLGEHVVVKPDRGGRGAHVKLMRQRRVKWQPDETRVGGKADALVAQKFIYTGPWPVSYRVTTLFGKVLWADKCEASRQRRALGGPDELAAAKGGVSIVSSGKGCTFAMTNEPDVIELAQAAHAAFPEHPLLGVDIIREQPSGKLWLIEVNSSGFVWHFSSPIGLKIQQEFNLDFEGQFDGIRKAGKILAEVTAREAK